NTEGFYADRSMFLGSGEFMPTADLALSVRKVTRAGSTRIAQTAFALAERRRKKVTAVHKANVLRVSDGLFLECVRAVASRFPGVEYGERIIDAMTGVLVRAPAAFDVIVTTNMFGDILSDLAAEISGSLGLAASLNAGDAHALAQAQHGSAPDIAGQDRANPASLIGSAAMLLNWLGERRNDERRTRAAATIGDATDRAHASPQRRPRGPGGPLGTGAVGRTGRGGGGGGGGRALAVVCVGWNHAAIWVCSLPRLGGGGGEGVSVRTRIFVQVGLILLHAPSLSLQPKSDISDFGRL